MRTDTVATGRGNVLVTEPEEISRTPLAIDEVGLIESQDHHGNWLDAVRTRGTTICDAEVGHRTATICHLMGIVERIGRPVRVGPGARRNCRRCLRRPLGGPRAEKPMVFFRC